VRSRVAALTGVRIATRVMRVGRARAPKNTPPSIDEPVGNLRAREARGAHKLLLLGAVGIRMAVVGAKPRQERAAHLA